MNIEYDEFIFLDKFDDLTPQLFNSTLQIIEAQFSGVDSLWSCLPPSEANSKRKLCFNYLIAWKLAVMYPDMTIGLNGTGNMPLSSKKVGPIFIKYKDVVRQSNSMLELLTTNQYGLEALTLIQAAPENFMVYA